MKKRKIYIVHEGYSSGGYVGATVKERVTSLSLRKFVDKYLKENPNIKHSYDAEEYSYDGHSVILIGDECNYHFVEAT